MRDWEPDLTAEWRRLSSKRWDRRQASGPPSWIVGVLVVVGIVLGLRYWASSAEPSMGTPVVTPPPTVASTSQGELFAHAAAPTWRRQVLRAPVRVVVADVVDDDEEVDDDKSPLDKLWSKTEEARARGDVRTALVGLRTIAQEHPEDARTAKAAFILAATTPAPEERCFALAMVVGLAPSSALATDARQRLPSACAIP